MESAEIFYTGSIRTAGKIQKPMFGLDASTGRVDGATVGPVG
jgi:hypothetical protein